METISADKSSLTFEPSGKKKHLRHDALWDKIRSIMRYQIIHFPTSSRVSELATEQTSERSGVRKQSE